MNRFLLGVLLVACLAAPPLPVPAAGRSLHVAMFAAAMLVAWGWYRRDAWQIRWDALAGSLVAYKAALLLSLAFACQWAPVPALLAGAARALLFAIAIYVALYVRDGPFDEPDTRFWVRLVFGAAIAGALYGCLDFAWQLPAPAGSAPQRLLLHGGATLRRAQAPFYDAGALGNLCVFLLVVCAAMAVQRRSVRVAPLWAIASGAAIGMTALVASYSRASLAGLGVALVALALAEWRRTRRWRLFTGLAAGVAVTAGAAWLVWGPVAGLHAKRFAVSLTQLATRPDAALSGRWGTWTAIAALLGDHPRYLLTGVGYRLLPAGALGEPLIPDNMYLSALAETGLPGLAALLAVLVAVLRTSWRLARSDDPMVALLGLTSFAFWCGQALQMLAVDLFTYWRLLPAYLFLLALGARRERVRATALELS
jgi:hypothetical protein